MVDKIIEGINRFQNEVFPSQEHLFRELASQQSPEVLFITCSDSRIDPNLITQTGPGDLFICRNAGNIIPPHKAAHTGGMTASIEYAVAVLGVKHIVICGHTDCGAMKAAQNPEKVKDSLPHVYEWLSYARTAMQITKDNCADCDDAERLQKLIEYNVLAQLQHIRTHPQVASGIISGKVTLHGWVYDIEKGQFKTYNEATKSFEPINMAQPFHSQQAGSAAK